MINICQQSYWPTVAAQCDKKVTDMPQIKLQYVCATSYLSYNVHMYSMYNPNNYSQSN